MRLTRGASARTADRVTKSARKQTGHIQGKERRRKSILQAAQDIIVDEGEAGLTMRAIAARAELSLVTPYNLFGSKQAILRALCEEELSDFFTAFSARPKANGAAQIFDLIDFTIERWGQQPELFRSLSNILYGKTGVEIGASVWGPRAAMMRGLLEEAVAAGDLRGDAPTSELERNLMRLFRAITQEWVDGLMTLEHTHREVGRAFVNLLTGYVTSRFEPVLRSADLRYSSSETIDADSDESAERLE